jgi:hypothetical protein
MEFLLPLKTSSIRVQTASKLFYQSASDIHSGQCLQALELYTDRRQESSCQFLLDSEALLDCNKESAG